MIRKDSHWTILWIFHVKAANERVFRQIYGPGGEWVRLFATDHNYLGTELLRHATRKRRYVTVDHWTSGAA